MFAKPITLLVAGMAAAILWSAPVLAAKISLSDEAIAEISGNANEYTISGNSSATASLAGGANGNIQFVRYQWSDDHSNDQSQNKGANNQSGPTSQVQQSISGHANAIVVGSVSQNVLINSGGSVEGSQNTMAYAVAASGGL